MPCIDQFQNPLQPSLMSSRERPTPPGFFQYQVQFSFMSFQDKPTPAGFFQYQVQSSFISSQERPAPAGFFQYAIHSSFIGPHVKEDAHPLKPKTIITAINASLFILPLSLRAFHTFSESSRPVSSDTIGWCLPSPLTGWFPVGAAIFQP